MEDNNLYSKLFTFSKEAEQLDKITRDILDMNLMVGNNHLGSDTRALRNAYETFLEEEFDEMFSREEKNGEMVHPLITFLDSVCDQWVVGSFLYSVVFREPYKTGICEAVPYDDIDTMKRDLTVFMSKIKAGEIKYVDDYLASLEDIFKGMKIDWIKALRIVHESNMSKFPTLSELEALYPQPKENILDLEVERLTRETSYHTISYEKVSDRYGNVRYVFWAKGDDKGRVFEGKGKFIKPITFFEPDLTVVLDGYID